METTTGSSANITQAVPFFGVTNIAESVRFYVDGLGFEMKRSWTPDGALRWCWLQRGGGALMLQEFRRDGHHANVPTEKLGVGVNICFQCEDAIALYKEFRSRGLDPRRPFVGNGLWVTWLNDPDGYRIEFESPTDAPEESEYADES
jgi:catechol 2,3-dioxygenase-like lactoylglutathione lyase family enzyme